MPTFFSLYYTADPKMEELGLLPDAEVAQRQYAPTSRTA